MKHSAEVREMTIESMLEQALGGIRAIMANDQRAAAAAEGAPGATPASSLHTITTARM